MDGYMHHASPPTIANLSGDPRIVLFRSWHAADAPEYDLTDQILPYLVFEHDTLPDWLVVEILREWYTQTTVLPWIHFSDHSVTGEKKKEAACKSICKTKHPWDHANMQRWLRTMLSDP